MTTALRRHTDHSGNRTVTSRVLNPQLPLGNCSRDPGVKHLEKRVHRLDVPTLGFVDRRVIFVLVCDLFESSELGVLMPFNVRDEVL